MFHVLHLDYELQVKAQFVAAKSQGQNKAEAFLLSQAELAKLGSASAKLA